MKTGRHPAGLRAPSIPCPPPFARQPHTTGRGGQPLARRATIALLAAAAWLAAGCATVSKKASCCAQPVETAAPVSDRSLFQLDSSWTNDAGAGLKLGALGGRPLVVTMFFTKCEYACPALVYDMKKVQAALPEPLRGRVGFVLVSFDTERDTPAALAAYRKIQELPDNWTLLCGSSDDVLELAALLGVKFKKDARGQFAHSNLITVLDPGGEPVYQQAGLSQPPDTIVNHLVPLLRP
ncbi:MAG TPA: SCO family protein [Methylomirabilota bacterium]|nr:SCO family protein [Methylomirabilota bacterium]